MKITIRHGVAFAGDTGRSRAGVYPLPTGAVVALADGQDDVAKAARAAETVLQYAEQLAADVNLRANYQVFGAHLAKLDAEIRDNGDASEASMIIAAVSEKGIAGYSVGDCRAWFFNEHGAVEMTGKQQEKPMIGSGTAALTPFAIQSTIGTVLVCSDGLWRNAEHNQMLKIAGDPDIGQATKSLLALPRYPSGGLPDDVAVIICRLEADE